MRTSVPVAFGTAVGMNVVDYQASARVPTRHAGVFSIDSSTTIWMKAGVEMSRDAAR